MNKTPIKTYHNGLAILGGNNYGEFPRRQGFVFSNLGAHKPKLPLMIFSSIVDEWHKECMRYRKHSDTFSVELVLEGQWLFVQDGKEYVVNPDEIFIVQLKKDSSMRCLTTTALKHAVIINGDALETMVNMLGISSLNMLKLPEPDRIHRIFDRLRKNAAKCTVENFRDASADCYALLCEIAQQAENRQYTPELLRARKYIHENLEAKLTLDEIAREVGISVSTLSRLFREMLHTSPMEYVLEQKMAAAMTLLKSRHYSVKEVAAKFSYSSPQYFATEFKKRYGITPVEAKH